MRKRERRAKVGSEKKEEGKEKQQMKMKMSSSDFFHEQFFSYYFLRKRKIMPSHCIFIIFRVRGRNEKSKRNEIEKERRMGGVETTT